MVKLKTIDDFLKWESFMSDAMQKELQAIPCPATIGRKEAPQDLNGITLGQLTTIQSASDSAALFEAIGEVLLHYTKRQTRRAPAGPMMGLANMVVRELERIKGLFETISPEPSALEIQAGSERLNFGIFGLADWYAKRMGMTDQDEAFNTGWVRIWQCLKNDTTEMQYRKRLAELQTAAINAKYKTR